MKRIAEKSKLINLPPTEPAPSVRPDHPEGRQPSAPPESAAGTTAGTAAPTHASRSFTGVGAMMAAFGQGGALGKELDEVKARLAEFEGSVPVRLLDPAQVRASAFVNRHDSEYESQAFAELKREIAQARVNVQPIKVRPARDPGSFEIVFGHRRHRACLDLGLDVLAIVEEVSDRDLWLQMDQENRGRRDLSPWEHGKSIQTALRNGLFPSVRRLAEHAGIDFSNAAKLLKLAELPDDVVSAFETPTDLQVHWAGLLSKALQVDPESVLERAKQISRRGTVPRPSKQVLSELLGEPAVRPAKESVPVRVLRDGALIATIQAKGEKRVLIEIHSAIDVDAVADKVAHWLGATAVKE